MCRDRHDELEVAFSYFASALETGSLIGIRATTKGNSTLMQN